MPEFTPEIAAKCMHQLIVASGVINITGQLEQIAVKQSPDPQAADRSAEKRGFQPSLIDGKPVPLKILLGIRLPAR